MSAETHHDTAPEVRTDGNYFLEHLQGLSDPRETLIVIQDALDVDLGERLDLGAELVWDDPDTVRAMVLTPRQYEGIKLFEELVGIYIGHGTFNPYQLGRWFNTIHYDMDNKRTIDVLFDGFNEYGFHPDSLNAISRHTSAFLSADGFDAVKARWGD